MALLIILVWLNTGPIFHFSDTWQLIINSLTSVVTFIMVFVIQYAQNKDTKAMNIKMDELIRSNEAARNKLVSIEDDPDHVLDEERDQTIKLARKLPKKAEGVR